MCSLNLQYTEGSPDDLLRFSQCTFVKSASQITLNVTIDRILVCRIEYSYTTVNSFRQYRVCFLSA